MKITDLETVQREYSSWLDWKPYDPRGKHKRRFSRMRSLSLRLCEKRLTWLETSCHNRALVESQARELLAELSKEQGAYKEYLKQKVGVDEFAHTVIEALM